VLEYAFGAATVASGWSGYFNSLLQQWGIYIPPQLTASTGTPLVFYQHQWLPVMSLPPGVSDAGLQHATGVCNLIAMGIVMVITTILVIGIKESANFNSAIVIIKLAIVGIFLAIGGYFLFKHPEVARTNWHPFIPPKDANGNFGWGGIPKGASRIFFAYIGFDAVSTAAQEAKKPQRDMPIGILGSLGVCTVLYILVSMVLTGLVSYKTLDVGAPVALGIDATGVSWGSMLVKIGAVFGLATVMLVMLLGQTRVFYSMSKDRLLPKWASAIHPKFRTPWITTIVFGAFAAIMPAFLPIDRLADLVNIGTLLAFTIVCAGVWVLRVRHPNLNRPFKTPFVPFIPALGIISAVYLMSQLAAITWEVMIGWLLFGLIIYFGYSQKHSKVQQMTEAQVAQGD
jgi:APA family basic amino acid/polyamine antiporter